MSRETIALLHPGDMGAVVGACLVANGHRVVWASEGRSGATRRRADAAGLEDVRSMKVALDSASVVLSICPPHAAVQLATSVGVYGFKGIYVDANAISRVTVRRAAQQVDPRGARFVDGGIIGPPPRVGGSTRLYLSGQESHTVAALFAATPLASIVLPGEVGAASALKMCYAAWSKGSSALLAAIRALSIREGVEPALINEWNLSQPGVAARSETITQQAHKAWRWVGEMEEIAASFAAADLPDGFHLSAAEIYQRLAEFKDGASAPSLNQITAALNRLPHP